MTRLSGKIEWAIYPRTGGGFIARPSDERVLLRYVWITADGLGWYKEVGHPPELLGVCKDIQEVIRKAMKL